MQFQRLSPHLYRFPDTCNVYVVLDPADPTRCVLIDFGDGACLDRLGEIGVSRVDWILHTHHHRDQAQGDHRAVARGIPLAVPAHERRLFDDVESFWKQRRIYHLYYVRNTYFTLTESVPVARELRDYETLRLGPLRLPGAPQPRAHPGLHHPPGADRRAAGGLLRRPHLRPRPDGHPLRPAVPVRGHGRGGLRPGRGRPPAPAGPGPPLPLARRAHGAGRDGGRRPRSSWGGACGSGTSSTPSATPPPWTPPSWRCSPG